MDKTELILSCRMPYNSKGVIRKLEGDILLVSRLRELGFKEGAQILKVSHDAHRCIILNLKGNKIYLNEKAAHSILVELL